MNTLQILTFAVAVALLVIGVSILVALRSLLRLLVEYKGEESRPFDTRDYESVVVPNEVPEFNDKLQPFPEDPAGTPARQIETVDRGCSMDGLKERLEAKLADIDHMRTPPSAAEAAECRDTVKGLLGVANPRGVKSVEFAKFAEKTILPITTKP